MKDEVFTRSMKSILNGLSDEASFELMAEALDKKEFLFVKQFCIPTWTISTVEPRYTSDFMTALLFTMMKDYQCELEVVQFLCDNYKIDPNSVSLGGQSLLEIAQKNGDVNIINYLIKLGAKNLPLI